MNLTNSLGVQTPKLVLLRHTPMQTNNVGETRGGGIATIIADHDLIWRPTLSNIKTVLTHRNVETRSEKLFESENIERENLRNIETRLK